MSNLLYLEIPFFIPEYTEDTAYSWSNKKTKSNLTDLLIKTSRGYCMYCYARILVDKKNFGQIEHSIERSFCRGKLEDCIPNLGVACPICNGSFKKRGYKSRKPSKKEIIDFSSSANCSENCYEKCEAYKTLSSKITKMKSGKIIFQPGKLSLEESVTPLSIMYNVAALSFEPNIHSYSYSSKEIDYINEHIRRFNLNSYEFRTKEITKLFEHIITTKTLPPFGYYNNLVADLFIEVAQHSDINKVVKFCNNIIERKILKTISL